MGFFKKLGRGLKKAAKPLLKKVVLKAARLGAGIVTGGLSEKAISVGKTVGAVLKKGKKQSKSVAAMLGRFDGMTSPKLATTASATTMPGGAPLKRITIAASSRRALGSRRKPPKRLPKGKVPKAPRMATAGKSKRKAPSGGLDLKGLSASWKAAGKPGTWQGWISSHK